MNRLLRANRAAGHLQFRKYSKRIPLLKESNAENIGEIKSPTGKSPYKGIPPKPASGGLGSALLSSLLLVSAVGFISYKIETDSDFADTITSRAPFVNDYLKPIGNFLRSAGIIANIQDNVAAIATVVKDPVVNNDVSANTSQSQDMAISHVDVTKTDNITTTVSEDAIDVSLSNNANTSNELATNSEEIQIVQTEEVPLSIVSESNSSLVPIIITEDKEALFSDLVIAEMKAKQMRVSIAAEIFDELTLQVLSFLIFRFCFLLLQYIYRMY